MSKINATTRHVVSDVSNLGRDMATAVIIFHDALSRRVKMSAAETRCMGVLNRLQSATPGQLAQETGLTTGAITGIVDRLEKAGYARREPNPKDRRSLLVRPINQERYKAITGPLYESLRLSMAEVAERYSAEQLDVIASYLLAITQVLHAQTKKLRTKAGTTQEFHGGSGHG